MGRVEDDCFCVFFVGFELIIVFECGFIMGISVWGLELKEVFLDIVGGFGLELIGLLEFKWFLVVEDFFWFLVLDDFWELVVKFFLWFWFVLLELMFLGEFFLFMFFFWIDEEVGLE